MGYILGLSVWVTWCLVLIFVCVYCLLFDSFGVGLRLFFVFFIVKVGCRFTLRCGSFGLGLLI